MKTTQAMDTVDGKDGDVEHVDAAAPSSHSVPDLPNGYDHLAHVPELAEAWQEQVLEHRAAARKLSLLMEYRERCGVEMRNSVASSGTMPSSVMRLIEQKEADKAAARLTRFHAIVTSVPS